MAESSGDDVHVHDFVRAMRRLEPHLPSSDAYERDRYQPRGAWWQSQKEHMVRWFSDQDGRGSGAFTLNEHKHERTHNLQLRSRPAVSPPQAG